MQCPAYEKHARTAARKIILKTCAEQNKKQHTKAKPNRELNRSHSASAKTPVMTHAATMSI